MIINGLVHKHTHLSFILQNNNDFFFPLKHSLVLRRRSWSWFESNTYCTDEVSVPSILLPQTPAERNTTRAACLFTSVFSLVWIMLPPPTYNLSIACKQTLTSCFSVWVKGLQSTVSCLHRSHDLLTTKMTLPSPDLGMCLGESVSQLRDMCRTT